MKEVLCSWILALGLLYTFILPGLASAESKYPQVEVLTSHFKPYSYLENNEPVGYSISQVKKVFEQLDYNPKIGIVKWKHVYNRSLHRPNILIFSLLRTPEREDKFHWIGKIGEVETFLFKKKGNVEVTVSSLDEGKMYITGVIERDAKGKYLSSKGYNLFPLTSQASAIKLLMRGRLDLILGDKRSLLHDLKELGLPSDTLIPVLKLEEVSKPIYLAFSKGTSTELVEDFRSAYMRAFHQE
ncbi:ABC transporter substrate-binding protein [Neptuniibacter sp.]|uniref:substrate-binding periplasmic protein n=1 Tax=Neptuniibacter sp. TaxID=1962643 RepID=UPI00260C6B95|nr:transporter substrate-binding domain-containing protein [Neptuniibacter sp.]MCP4596135.1 transporter substrate-binding domain-containing protein [Neptuniibacter sp.]